MSATFVASSAPMLSPFSQPPQSSTPTLNPFAPRPKTDGASPFGHDGATDTSWAKKANRKGLGGEKSDSEARPNVKNPFKVKDGNLSDGAARQKKKKGGDGDRKGVAMATNSRNNSKKPRDNPGTNGKKMSRQVNGNGANVFQHNTSAEEDNESRPTSSSSASSVDQEQQPAPASAPITSKDPFAIKVFQQLRKDGISPPSWPSQPGNPKQKAEMAKFRDRYEAYRNKARVSLTKAGLIDDPTQRRTLQDAIDFRGICEDMCPEYEKITRITELDVPQPEKDPKTTFASVNRMVKKLARSAAGQEAPLPMDVRSTAALRRSLNYLVDDLLRNDDNLPEVHGFLWDRTRAIRRDFAFLSSPTPEDMKTQAHVLENIARFHVTSLHLLSQEGKAGEDFVEQQELEQLGKALLSLRDLYDDCNAQGITCENEAEFRAYYLIFHAQDSNIIEMLQRQWKPHFWKDSDEIRTAACLVEALQNTVDFHGPLTHAPSLAASSSFLSYFRIVEDPKVSYTMACFAECHFPQLRRSILRAVRRAMARPKELAHDVNAETLNKYLRFDTVAQAIDFAKFHDIDFVSDEQAPNDLSRQLMVLNNKGPLPCPRLQHQFSQNLVERKRGSRSLPEIIHQTHYEASPSAISTFVNSRAQAPEAAAHHQPSTSGSMFFRNQPAATVSEANTPFSSQGQPANVFGNTPSIQSASTSPFGGAGGTPHQVAVQANPFGNQATVLPGGVSANPFAPSARIPAGKTAVSPFAPAVSSSNNASAANPFGHSTPNPSPAFSGLSPNSTGEATKPQTTANANPFSSLLQPGSNGPGFPPSQGARSLDRTATGAGPSVPSPFAFNGNTFTTDKPSTTGLAAISLTQAQPTPGTSGFTLGANSISSSKPHTSVFEAIPTTSSATSSSATAFAQLNNGTARPPTSLSGLGTNNSSPSVFNSQSPSLNSINPNAPASGAIGRQPATTTSITPSSGLLASKLSALGNVEGKTASPFSQSKSVPSTTPPTSPPQHLRYNNPPPPVVITPPRDLLGDFTKWFVQGDNGLFQEFESFILENIVTDVFDTFQKQEEERKRKEKEERDEADAKKFRTYNISLKYFYRWKTVARERRLKQLRRNGREQFRAFHQAQREAQLKEEKLAVERAAKERAALAKINRPEEFAYVLRQSQKIKRKAEDELLASGVLAGVENERAAISRIVRREHSLSRDVVSLNGDFRSRSRSGSIVSSLGGSKTRALREELLGPKPGRFRRSLPSMSPVTEGSERSPRISKVSERWKLKAMGIVQMPDGTALPETMADEIKLGFKRDTQRGRSSSRRRISITSAPRNDSRHSVSSVRQGISPGSSDGVGTTNKRKRIGEDEDEEINRHGELESTASHKRVMSDAQNLIRELRAMREEMEEGTMWFKSQNGKLTSDIVSRGGTPLEESGGEM